MLLRAVSLFTERHPDCEVHVHEAPLAGTRSSLRDGTIDVLIASYPFDGMANGPVLMRERRVRWPRAIRSRRRSRCRWRCSATIRWCSTRR
ncbi:hypothetical protein [Micromonospora marina]|uniref:hypothetical protein n=1 Tax=Micromonospora marina TaxID=307120 RepID=UPI003D718A4D